MSRRKKSEPAVSWHLPDGKGGFKKRPFAYSTQAESDYMRALSSVGNTFYEAVTMCSYAPTERTICQAFIDAGYGRHYMREFIK